MLNPAKTFFAKLCLQMSFRLLKVAAVFWTGGPLIGFIPFLKRSNLPCFKISIGGQDAIFAETYLELFTKSDDKDGNLAKT